MLAGIDKDMIQHDPFIEIYVTLLKFLLHGTHVYLLENVLRYFQITPQHNKISVGEVSDAITNLLDLVTQGRPSVEAKNFGLALDKVAGFARSE